MGRIARCIPLLLLGGCLIQNIAPSERLRDAVVGLNDEARWSRMDLASMRVAPSFRRSWKLAHRDWGRTIHIGDVELLEVRIDDTTDTAFSVVAVSWYSYDTMTLQRTVLRQEWASEGRAFVLTKESVVEGSPDIFSPEPRATASASTSS